MKIWYVVIGLLVIGLAMFSGIVLVLAWPNPWPAETKFGVTFSARQARGLGLDERETYLAILDELNVRRLRLVVYWDQVEPAEGKFSWDDLDWQMNEAAKRGAQVILTIGRKVPHWPECFVPGWAKPLPEPQQQAKVLRLLSAIVNRYKNNSALQRWQLENEPFLNYGECPPTDTAFLRQEEELLQSLDGTHPILVTDSGELNWWLSASRYGDILGTTMYRTVYSQKTGGLFKYDYIFPAWLYRVKARLVKLISNKDVIVSELQGEPWTKIPFVEASASDRQKSFSPARFKQIAGFARRTQLPEAYWWGAEYWCWEKQVNNNPDYWQTAQQVFTN